MVKSGMVLICDDAFERGSELTQFKNDPFSVLGLLCSRLRLPSGRAGNGRRYESQLPGRNCNAGLRLLQVDQDSPVPANGSRDVVAIASRSPRNQEVAVAGY